MRCFMDIGWARQYEQAERMLGLRILTAIASAIGFLVLFPKPHPAAIKKACPHALFMDIELSRLFSSLWRLHHNSPLQISHLVSPLFEGIRQRTLHKTLSPVHHVNNSGEFVWMKGVVIS